SNVRLLRGEPDAGIAHAEEEIALCREYGLAQELEWGRSYHGLALATLGRTEEGIAELTDSLAAQRRISAGLLRGMFLTFLAEALSGACPSPSWRKRLRPPIGPMKDWRRSTKPKRMRSSRWSASTWLKPTACE